MLRYLFLEDNTLFGKIQVSKLSIAVLVASFLAGIYATAIGTTALPYIILFVGYLLVGLISYLVVNSKRKKIRQKAFVQMNNITPVVERDFTIRWDNTTILAILATSIEPLKKEKYPVLEEALSQNVQPNTGDTKWWISDNVVAARDKNPIYARYSSTPYDTVGN